jgi:hypothetical protein
VVAFPPRPALLPVMLRNYTIGRNKFMQGYVAEDRMT